MSDSAPAKRRGRPPKARPVEPEAEQSDAVEVVGEGGDGESGGVPSDGQQIDAGLHQEIVPASAEPARIQRANAGLWLSQHERHGLIEEALYTHEMQLEHIRFDSKNRRWVFRPESRQNRANLMIHLKRGPDEREALIDNAKFGAENVREDVEAAIDLLDEALS